MTTDSAISAAGSSELLHLTDVESALLVEARICEGRIHAALAKVMQEVALPESCRIGQILATVRDLNPPGKKGPGGRPSPFYAKVEQTCGWGKRTVQNYISIFENYDRLMAHLCDPPPGARPITSLRAALETITWLNATEARKALPPAPAVTVKATTISVKKTSPIRKHRASITREVKAVLAYASTAMPSAAEAHRPYLVNALEALSVMLDQLADEEEAADLPEGDDTVPMPDWGAAVAEPAPPAPTPPAGPTEADLTVARGELKRRYPETAEGLKALDHDVLTRGGKAVAAELGITTASLSQARSRRKKALREQAES